MLALNKIYNKNCVLGLKELDDDSVDLVVTNLRRESPRVLTVG